MKIPHKLRTLNKQKPSHPTTDHHTFTMNLMVIMMMVIIMPEIIYRDQTHFCSTGQTFFCCEVKILT